jgi:Spy/CpxP family protein refolding chaperone
MPGVKKAGPLPLPKNFDKLELTDSQKERVNRVMEAYAPRLAEVRAKLDLLSRVRTPGASSLLISMSLVAKKLINQRQHDLMAILAEEQKARLQALNESSNK